MSWSWSRAPLGGEYGLVCDVQEPRLQLLHCLVSVFTCFACSFCVFGDRKSPRFPGIQVQKNRQVLIGSVLRVLALLEKLCRFRRGGVGAGLPLQYVTDVRPVDAQSEASLHYRWSNWSVLVALKGLIMPPPRLGTVAPDRVRIAHVLPDV